MPGTGGITDAEDSADGKVVAAFLTFPKSHFIPAAQPPSPPAVPRKDIGSQPWII